jgi:hypothetical protein
MTARLADAPRITIPNDSTPSGRRPTAMLAHRLIALLPSLLLGACVTASAPVGSQPHQLDPDDWAGTWSVPGESSLTVRVADARAGLLDVAWVSEGPDGLEVERVALHVREHGGWLFASYEDAEEPGYFVWGRVRLDDDVLLGWFPDREKIRRLVEDSVLPGDPQPVEADERRVIAPGVILGPLTDEHLDVLASETHGVLYDWDEPFVAIRVGDASSIPKHLRR